MKILNRKNSDQLYLLKNVQNNKKKIVLCGQNFVIFELRPEFLQYSIHFSLILYAKKNLS